MTAVAFDPVHRAPHYNFGTIEVIDVIQDWHLNFTLGCALKYIARAGRKGSPADELQDLEKAVWNVQRHIVWLRAHPNNVHLVEPRQISVRDVLLDWNLRHQRAELVTELSSATLVEQNRFAPFCEVLSGFLDLEILVREEADRFREELEASR
jgi:hypothetical protein